MHVTRDFNSIYSFPFIVTFKPATDNVRKMSSAAIYVCSSSSNESFGSNVSNVVEVYTSGDDSELELVLVSKKTVN